MSPSISIARKNSRILVTRCDRIGDLVLSTPVFAALRGQFPGAWIACLTFLENREIVEGNPNLDEVILYDKGGAEKGIAGNLRFAARLARKKFDVVLHLHATARMHWVSWLAGIPVRIGWRRKNGWLLTHALPDIKREGKRHEAEYNFDLLALLGVACPDPVETYFPISEKAGCSLEELLRHHEVPFGRPWVVLSPSASCPSKRWPADRFRALAEKIAEKYDAVFLLIGSREERPLTRRIASALRIPVYDLSGLLTLSMLGSLLRRSALLVSNDSGPVHIAASVGTPVISIFGRKDAGLSPARWRPLGARSRVIHKDVGCEICLAHNCQIHFLCLDAVGVGEVMRCVEELDGRLGPKKKGGRNFAGVKA